MTEPLLDKNSPDANTCENKSYSNLFQGFNYQIKDTFFFSFIIQFILVSLMYIHVGNGKYWKVLFYSATAGLIGAAIENTTLAFICQTSQKDNNQILVFTFFAEEFFWIICEYSVPYLNLIKMEAISNEKYVKVIRYIILFLILPFGSARLYNGYDRMMEGYLNTKKSRICHGISFGTMAIADIICTLSIIYLVKRKTKKGTFRNSSISGYIKNSSYTILICVDIVSLILSILFIFSSLIFPDNKNLESSTSIFHCLKSVFILILATDAIIFKYGVANNSHAIYDLNNRLNKYDYYYKKTKYNNNNTFIIDVSNNSSSNSKSPLTPISPITPASSNSSYGYPASLGNSKGILKHSPSDSNNKFGGGLFFQADLTDYMYKTKDKNRD